MSKTKQKTSSKRTQRASQARSVAGQPSSYRSQCAIARTLDIVGDKWSLLIVRDVLLRKKRTYSQLASCAETIPTNILAQRLKWLVEQNILAKELYQEHPPRFRYEPTPKCEQLKPILQAMINFGRRELEGQVKP